MVQRIVPGSRHCSTIAARSCLRGARSVMPASASIKIGTPSGKLRAVVQCGWAVIWYVVGGVRICHEPHPTQRCEGVASGFSAPAILAADKFTRLAQVTGDADCDRPLTFSSDV